MTDRFWALGKRHETRRCLGCGLPVTSRPADDCPEPRHAAFHRHRREANNLLRKQARADARARGEVKRYGTPEAKKARSKRAHHRRRMKIIDALGGCCSSCGHTDFRAVQVHHRNGGGSKERRALGWSYLLLMVEMTAGQLRAKFRLLCANCHQVEHYEARSNPA